VLQQDQILEFQALLLAWYRSAKRDLPWRRSRDPYAIWVSEIMLQQTRVAAAIPYYERFLDRFPDFAALAKEKSIDKGSGQQGAANGPGGSSGSGFAPGSSNGTAGGVTPTSYRLSGTITAISGSTVTIKTSSGSRTYTVTSSTHLQRNGSTVSLSSFKVGDSVFGSTTTSGGTTLNDLMAGTGGMGGAPGGAAPGSSSGSGTASTSGTSSSTGSSTT